jgi:hypothetical protein
MNTTGGAFNPATATARALVHMDGRNLSIYWLGPMLGHFLAALLRTYVCESTRAQPLAVSSPEPPIEPELDEAVSEVPDEVALSALKFGPDDVTPEAESIRRRRPRTAESF